MPEVSIIVPVYKAEAFLRECVDSILSQTFPDFEVILVDNASTDDSLSVARELFPDIKEVILPENFGFCRAVNEGIRSSRAPFVLLLNNDTVVDENFVGSLYEAIRKKKKIFSLGV